MGWVREGGGSFRSLATYDYLVIIRQTKPYHRFVVLFYEITRMQTGGARQRLCMHGSSLISLLLRQRQLHTTQTHHKSECCSLIQCHVVG